MSTSVESGFAKHWDHSHSSASTPTALQHTAVLSCSLRHCSKAAIAATVIHLPMAHVEGCRCYICSGPTPYRWLLPSTICLLFFSGNLFCNLARKAALNKTPVMNWDCISEKREFKVSFTIFGNMKTSMLSLKWNSIIGILCELWQYAPINWD